jgi:hypothetical protein
VSKKKKMGRPSGLTPEIQETLCLALRNGNFVDTACIIAGISKQTFYTWAKLGNKEQPGEPHREFLDSIKKALAEAESSAILAIRGAGRFQWQALAWFLERRFRDKWAKNSDLGTATPNVNAASPMMTVTERPADYKPPSDLP